jgi:uncharacterized peroxidase-related enzyme
MSLIATPVSIETSPSASQPLLAAVKKQLGVVPNMFRLIGNSPAALEGYLGLNGALSKGTLDVKTRERLALVVAQENGCEYCLAAHTYLGKNVAKLDEDELAKSRNADSSDPKVSAALRFARAVVQARGHVGEHELRAVRAAGYSDAQVLEIVLHVALNTLTNYVNEVGKTDIDFPAAGARQAA